MFHVDRSNRSSALLAAIFVLLGTMMIATASTVWLVLEVRKERNLVEEVLAGRESQANFDAQILASEVGWQAIFSWLILGVLMIAAVALILMMRAYSQSEQFLRDLQALSLDVLASIDKAVITIDSDGMITSVNPACQRMLDLPPDAIGTPLRQMAAPPAILELADRVLSGGRKVTDFEFSVRTPKRTSLYLADCEPLKDSSDRPQGAVVYVGDVTERSLLEERMRRMERYMGLGSLAAGLHHEIKNPLGALSLHIQLLEEKLGEDSPPGAAEHLQVLKTEITRVGGVLESFRDFASSTKLNAQPTDLGALVEQAVRLIQPQTEQQGIEIRYDNEAGGDIQAEVDAARLEQVLLNLLLNASEAIEGNGRIHVRLFIDSLGVQIEVSDTGPGIPEDILPRVFDPYFTTKPRGSGMGLAVCQKIAQQHGGSITYDTGPDGTLFRLSLPVAASTEAAAEIPSVDTEAKTR